ncbi:MAG: prepilin peptidase [Lachnospiraceae bacterium]|nr:prepilin peptidase [Lachnospiraceae bacterium]
MMREAYGEIFFQAAALVFLAAASLLDLRIKKVDIVMSGFFALLGLTAGILFGEKGIWDYLLPFLPGLFLFLFSLMSRGAIGMGDGIVVLVLGFYFPFDELAGLLTAAFFLAAVYGALVFLKRRKGGERFAFVPFLFLAGLWRAAGRYLW